MNNINIEGMKDVRTLCAENNIELRGDDGQPYCCGLRMTTKAGVYGTDYAECLSCGKRIGNSASPHINGGYIFNEKFFENYGENTWVLLAPKPKGRGE